MDIISVENSNIVAKNPKKEVNKTSKKSSHLYNQEKHLKIIPKSTLSKETLVIYLYGNNLTSIENLNGYPNLTSLYLQNNSITEIRNLQYLKKLKKLYIGHNEISVLEGLNSLESLEELHIEKQSLPNGSCLCFDPRTIFSISPTLQILNVSGNNIPSLSSLTPLRNLRVIDASDNDLDDIKDICQTIRNWYYLTDANFTGNSVKKEHHYREAVIGNTNLLRVLDGKTVSDVTRSFVRKFKEEKLLRTKQCVILSDVVKGLPKNYPPPLKKAVSASMLKGSKCKLLDDMSTFDEKNAVFMAWQALPKRRPYIKSPLLKRKQEKSMRNEITNKFP